MKVKSLRKVRIASLSGHIVVVPAMEATEIPDAIADEAFAKGCVPVDDKGNVLDEDTVISETPAETEETGEVDEEQEANELQDRLFAAFETLIEANDEADFNKNTKAPKVGAVARVLGEKVSAEVVDEAWGEFLKE